MSKKGIKIITNGFRNIFNLLYQCLTDTDFDIPITKEELEDPKSEFTQIMFYMYSLEPPIYYHLNKACKIMDPSKLYSWPICQSLV